MTEEFRSSIEEPVEIYVVKLISGETIIADMSVDIETLPEVNRVQMFLPALLEVERDGAGGKFIYISPWLMHSESVSVEIATKHILFADVANEATLKLYTEFAIEMQEAMAKGSLGEVIEEEEDSIEEGAPGAKKLLH